LFALFVGLFSLISVVTPARMLLVQDHHSSPVHTSDTHMASNDVTNEIGGSSGLLGNESRADVYRIGAGIADVTGPAAEVNMMGYARFGQDTGGIHTRLYARTFIIEDENGNRVVYISCDIGMIDQSVKTQVSKTLTEKYAGLYTQENILISGTHTHSGPGGFLQYLLYTIVSQGFTKQTFDAVVNGIVLSVDRAHGNMTAGQILWNEGQLLNASINRSPTAYLNNTKDERDRYEHDTDKNMYLMKFVSMTGQPLGLITWFAVHPTSMNNTNTLISGDNKGIASLLFEAKLNGPDHLPGKGPFVAAFSNANLGDVSPNLNGPKCMNTGEPCDDPSSTCGGKSQMCIATGPGRDMFESTEIIATRQYEKALQLYESATQVISGPVSFIHQHLDMSKQNFTSRYTNQPVSTCKPAMGYSFAAGTVDGPGAFDFKQGTTSGNVFWNLVRDFIAKPNKEMIECQAPKPILLATGLMNFPYQWQPTILPTQIIRIGNVLLAAVPAEFTTMSGRRMKEMLKSEADQILGPDNGSETKVVLAGLSNAYSSYVTTFEEYQVQRYEGASTIFGPHTLEAYMNQYSRLLKGLLTGSRLPAGPDPPNLLKKQLSLRPGVVYDGCPLKKGFGEVISQPLEMNEWGETVTVTFVAGHPRNNLMLEGTYLTIERRVNDQDNEWKVIATDASIETKFIWKRTNSILGQSIAIVEWKIPEDTAPGLYRIQHFGSYKTLLQSIKSYSGTSKAFRVVPKLFRMPCDE
jgi:neutral ceramidase